MLQFTIAAGNKFHLLIGRAELAVNSFTTQYAALLNSGLDFFCFDVSVKQLCFAFTWPHST